MDEPQGPDHSSVGMQFRDERRRGILRLLAALLVAGLVAVVVLQWRGDDSPGPAGEDAAATTPSGPAPTEVSPAEVYGDAVDPGDAERRCAEVLGARRGGTWVAGIRDGVAVPLAQDAAAFDTRIGAPLAMYRRGEPVDEAGGDAVTCSVPQRQVLDATETTTDTTTDPGGRSVVPACSQLLGYDLTGARVLARARTASGVLAWLRLDGLPPVQCLTAPPGEAWFDTTERFDPPDPDPAVCEDSLCRGAGWFGPRSGVRAVAVTRPDGTEQRVPVRRGFHAFAVRVANSHPATLPVRVLAP